jgi:MoaA/NifB/PqqE/SkfB family radical SAM enzyme
MSPCPRPCYHPGQRFSTDSSKNFFRLEPFGSLESVNRKTETFVLRDPKETKQYLDRNPDLYSHIDNILTPSSKAKLSLLDLSIPYYIRLDFTYRCNLGCIYCYSASSPSREDTMPFPVFKSVVDMLKKELLYGIQVLGGEPFLFPEYLYYLLANCSFPHIVISTNGSLLTPEICDNLSNLSPKATINIGLDSNDPIIHNSLRGHFSDILNAIEALNKRDIRMESSVCLTKYNIWRLYELVAFLIDNNFKAVQFIPVGTAHLPNSIGKELLFSVDDKLNEYFHNIYTRYSSFISMNFLFPLSFLNNSAKQIDKAITFGPCDGGILSACIRPNNTMSACPAAPNAPFVNLEERNLSDSWQLLKKHLFRNGLNIEERNDSLIIKQQCKYYGYGQTISDADLISRNDINGLGNVN